MPRTRRLLSLLLLAALALDGCATYPTAMPLSGQDAATTARDERECRERAEHEVASPLAVGLGTKVVWAIGGAVVGGGVGLSTIGDGTYASNHPEVVALAVVGGAALGFVVGSIVGTFKGAEEGTRLSRSRELVFTRCMSGRGYGVP